ncbi:thioredoxin family protein [bacterium]|nr:thioredoxin family protein [bacterium]
MNTFVWGFISFIGAFIALMLFVNLKVVLAGRKRIGTPVPYITGKLGNKIAAGDALCFYFFSPMCGACKTMTPMMESLQPTFPGVIQVVNIQRSADIAKKLGVQATPTTVMIKNGKIAHFIVGVRPSSRLSNLIKSLG